MEDGTIKKLNDILNKHSNKISGIRKFNQHFDELKLRVDKLILEINPILNERTGDQLQIDWDGGAFATQVFNEYVFKVSIAPVDTILSNSYLHKSKKSSDHVSFLGYSSEGEVELSIVIDSENIANVKASSKGPILELTDEIITSHLLDLIDLSYSE